MDIALPHQADASLGVLIVRHGVAGAICRHATFRYALPNDLRRQDVLLFVLPFFC